MARRRSASPASPPRPTWSAGSGIRPSPTASGSPTSPTCAPGRAGSTWPRSSTATLVAASAGRSPTTCAQRSSSTPARWRFGGAVRDPASSITQTTARNTSRSPWASICARRGSRPRWDRRVRRSQRRRRVVLLDAQARARQPLLVADQGRREGRHLRVDRGLLQPPAHPHDARLLRPRGV